MMGVLEHHQIEDEAAFSRAKPRTAVMHAEQAANVEERTAKHFHLFI
jgi:hypothetical protein